MIAFQITFHKKLQQQEGHRVHDQCEADHPNDEQVVLILENNSYNMDRPYCSDLMKERNVTNGVEL